MIALSYRREDTLAVAGRLYDRLEHRFGKANVFMDFDSIRPGFDFRDQIRDTIERSKVVIVVIGPNWVGQNSDGTRRIDDPTDFVRLEVACALQRGIPVIPVLVNNTPMPKAEILPSDIQPLAFRHALPLDSGLDFRQHAERLIDSFGSTAKSRHQSSSRAVDGTTNTGRFIVSALAIGALAGVLIAIVLVWRERSNTVRTEHRPQATQRNITSAQASNFGTAPTVKEKTSEKPPLSNQTSSSKTEASSVSRTPDVKEQSKQSTESTPAVEQRVEAPETAKAAAPTPVPVDQPINAGVKFDSVTKEKPYENSLGMRFIPIVGTHLLFSIWDTRVQDYEIFVKETRRQWKKPAFTQTPGDPAVNVSWEESKAFCAWLTEKEQEDGRLTEKQQYRLPTDAEWSVAVGPGKYPWGNQWPPKHGAGNYSPSLQIDDYDYTSPVGTFEPNSVGLYDMGGNVWQWCEDWYRKEMNSKELLDSHPDLKSYGDGKTLRVVRGGSFYVGSEAYLQSSIRIGGGSSSGRNSNNGFRCVLSESKPATGPTEDKLAPTKQKLALAFVKKYGVSLLLPVDIFPDAERLATTDQDSLKGVTWSGRTTISFSAVHGELKKVYSDFAAEHTSSAPDKAVYYKVCRDKWFVVSGDLGPNEDAYMGFYIKGVKKGSDVIIMNLEYLDNDVPFYDDDTFNAVSRSFKLN